MMQEQISLQKLENAWRALLASSTEIKITSLEWSKECQRQQIMKPRNTKKTSVLNSGQPTCRLSDKLRNDSLSLRAASTILDHLGPATTKVNKTGCLKSQLQCDTTAKNWAISGQNQLPLHSNQPAAEFKILFWLMLRHLALMKKAEFSEADQCRAVPQTTF